MRGGSSRCMVLLPTCTSRKSSALCDLAQPYHLCYRVNCIDTSAGIDSNSQLLAEFRGTHESDPN